MTKQITLILNRSPYGDEYAYNALRFATALIANGVKVNIFLLGDGAYIAKSDQTPPKNAINIQEMLKDFNEGRSKSYYCIATTVLEINELKKVLEKAIKETKGIAIKEKSLILHSIIDEIAKKKNYQYKIWEIDEKED